MKKKKIKRIRKKFKCLCGCGGTLYIQDWEGDLIIGSDSNGKLGFKNNPGVIIKKNVLIKVLK